ncbi:hypothetical protein [Enterococcus mundtii]|uniref:hypothetical protein n=1 Tax=Enterococcus mundtii TaxID=53346 RepID=UPI0035C6771E
MSEIKEKDKTNEKKKVQVNINKNLATDVESILDSLGVNPSILITANNQQPTKMQINEISNIEEIGESDEISYIIIRRR